MWHRLAMMLHCTITEAKRRMSSAEFTQWIVFWHLHPFGPDIEALQAGIIAAAVLNANRDPKSSPVSPQDMVMTAAPAERMSEDEMLAGLMKWQQSATCLSK